MTPGEWQRSGHRGQVLHCLRDPAWASPGYGTAYCGISLYSAELPASEGRRCARCARRRGRAVGQTPPSADETPFNRYVFGVMQAAMNQRLAEWAGNSAAPWHWRLPYGHAVYWVAGEPALRVVGRG